MSGCLSCGEVGTREHTAGVWTSPPAPVQRYTSHTSKGSLWSHGTLQRPGTRPSELDSGLQMRFFSSLLHRCVQDT